MLFIDIMSHLRNLNSSLQWKDKIVSDLAQTIFSFQNKIKLLPRGINTKYEQHFPLLKGIVNSENDLCS